MLRSFTVLIVDLNQPPGKGKLENLTIGLGTDILNVVTGLLSVSKTYERDRVYYGYVEDTQKESVRAHHHR